MTTIGHDLLQRLDGLRDHDLVDVDIFARNEPRPTSVARDAPVLTRPDTIDEFKRSARESQIPIIAKLVDVADTTDYPRVITGRRWINNSISALLRRDQLNAVVELDDIEHVEVAHYADLEVIMDQDSQLWSTSPSVLTTHKQTNAWGIDHINAPGLWKIGINGNGITCAVIDTGVNYHHPDLRDRMWNADPRYPNHGYDFERHDDDPMDIHGHGTACAGIVAGTGRQGLRTGVAPKATLMALRVGGTERNYWDALEFAIDNGADVISMSMSWKYPSSPDYPGWRRACETVLAAGLLHANSIGNQGSNLVDYPVPYNIATPGNCPPPWLHPKQSPKGGVSSVISCGATDSTDRLAPYSGRGPATWDVGPYLDYPYRQPSSLGLLKPDLCAPGPGTYSCHWQHTANSGPSPYRSFGGTSAATPHVAGALCLLAHATVGNDRDRDRAVVPAHVQEALEQTTVRVTGQTLDKENHYGSGRIDVLEAFEFGKTHGFW